MQQPASIETDREAHVAAGARLSSRLWPTFRLIGAALFAALLVRVLLVQPFGIPSGSMAPTLETGDFVLVDKQAYGWSLASLPLAAPLTRPDGVPPERIGGAPPERGDVLAFIGPDGRDYVKRLVAIGGDRVAMQSGTLMLNGTPVPCKGEGNSLCRETLPNGPDYLVSSSGTGPYADFAEIRIPEGQLFLLGDNRDFSTDSRVTPAEGGIGLVPQAQLIGRAAWIFLSVDGTIRWNRIGRAID